MTQQEVSITHSIKVSPEQAWEVIGSVGGVDKWFGSMIKSCRIEGKKRICETADGMVLNEDILEIDHENRIFRFGIPSQEMLPVENIVESMQVGKNEQGDASITWSASFDATAENAQVASEAFSNLWVMGLNEMETYILKTKQA